MPNARDATGPEYESILLIGPPGSGKTTQFLTLPGPTFIHIFDPNALASLRGHDIDYELFLPDKLDINIHPLAKAKPEKGIKPADKVVTPSEPLAYVEFEEFLFTSLDNGFYDKYQFIGIDSMTTFQDCVMDRVQYLNGRMGKHPEEADWTAQMTTVHNVYRTLAAQNRVLVSTAHEEMYGGTKDKQGIYQPTYWRPVMTGRLRIRIPLLFSNILRCEADVDRAGNVEHVLHLVSDKDHKYIRTSFKGEPPELRATIEDMDHPQDYGLGALWKRHMPAASQRVSSPSETQTKVA